jgi:predicted ArsR family transcriptional regulator
VERTDRDVQVAGIAALDQPLRRDLYALLVRRGDWVGRDEAAEELGLARSVAAFHLDKLVEAGLLDVSFERPEGRGGPGAGRPAKRYRRSSTEVAVSLPDRRYGLAGTLLADAVNDAATTGQPVTEALAEAARLAGQELGQTVRAELPTRPSAAAERAAAVRALEGLGYEPRKELNDIVLSNCPFHALAERHRSLVCGMNLDLLCGLAEGMDAGDTLAPRLEPTEGNCCVRLRGAR